MLLLLGAGCAGDRAGEESFKYATAEQLEAAADIAETADMEADLKVADEQTTPDATAQTDAAQADAKVDAATPVDSGQDTVADATGDAGATDSSADAATLDAANPDDGAGALDGAADGTWVDAGQLDGASVDVASVDGGPADGAGDAAGDASTDAAMTDAASDAAGGDGSTTDAAAGDGGAIDVADKTDTTSDAAPVDASADGSADAAAADGGPADSGAADGGMTDAGPADGAQEDAASDDGSQADGGGVDAGPCGALKDGDACDDGNACTTVDTCKAGSCQGGKAPNCDDGKPCTVDGCDKAKGCTHVAAKDGQPCDDGDLCTAKDGCKAGICAPGKALVCTDGNTCTTDSCDKAKGCVHKASKDGVKCDDGSACTVGDGCASGSCKAGPGQVFASALPPVSQLRSVVARQGGGWLAVGDRDKAGGQKQEAILVAFDDSGKAQWTIAPADGDKARGVGVLQLKGGDIVIAATVESPVPSAALIRVDSKGKNNTQYGLFMSGYIKPTLAAMASDGAGGAFFVGQATDQTMPNTGIDGWLVRTNSDLKTTWQSTWGDKDGDGFNGVVAIAGGAAAVGTTQVKGVAQGWALRVDKDGKSMWQKSWPGKGVGGLSSVAATDQGGLVMAGTSGVKVSDRPWLLAVDGKGELTWQQHLDKLINGGALSIAVHNDGSLALAGHIPSASWLARTTATGGLLWHQTWMGGVGDRAATVLPLANGGLLVAGQRTTSGKIHGVLQRTDAWGHDDCAEVGKCLDPALKKCDDNKPCTGDLCHGKTGCSHKPLGGGLPYGGGKLCYAGSCELPKCASAKDCSDGDVCTDDVCVVATGTCKNPQNTADCDDGNACTLGEACANGICAGGKGRLFSGPLKADKTRSVLGGWAAADGSLRWFGHTVDKVKGNRGLVASTDFSGQPTGEQLYGDGGDHSLRSALPLTDGGAIYCGIAPDQQDKKFSGVWRMRVDAAGKVVWQHTFSDGKSTWCNRVRRLSDGDLLFFGGRQNNPAKGDSTDMFAVGTDANGKSKFAVHMDSAGSYDYSRDAAAASDGGFITCAQSFFGSSGRYDGFMTRHDDAGNKVWEQRYGSGTGNGLDDMCGAVVAMPGGFLVAGRKGSPAGKHYGKTWLWAIKDANKGPVLWEKLSKTDNKDAFLALTAVPGGGWLASGMRAKDLNSPYQGWLWRLDGKGAPLWSQLYSGGSHGQFGPLSMLPDGGLVTTMEVGSENKWSHIMVRADRWGHPSCKSAGVCATPKPSNCDDGKPCNYDLCDAKTGCTSTGTQPDGASCDDGQPCTIATTCKSGGCQGGSPASGVFAGPDGYVMELLDAHPLSDGDIAWTGNRYFDFNSKTDGWLMRSDGSGKEKFTKGYNYGVNNYFNRSILLPGNRIAIAGSSEQGNVLTTGKYRLWMGLYAADGTVIWQGTKHPNEGSNSLRGLAVRPDGMLIAVGGINSNGKSTAPMVAVDLNGNVKWSVEHDGTKYDLASDVAIGNDGQMYVVGQSASAGNGGNDGWLFATDATGKMLWQKHHGGVLSDTFKRVVATPTGAIAWGTRPTNKGVDLWLLASDAKGAVQWQQFLPGGVSGNASGLRRLSTGELLGSATSRPASGKPQLGLLLRMDAKGALLGLHQHSLKNPADGKPLDMFLHNVVPLGDGRLALPGGAYVPGKQRGWRAVTDRWGNATCHAGCAGSSWSVCDDGKKCTLDSCDASTGKCAHQPSPAAGCP